MTLTEFMSELVGRVHGPFSFRFVIQPVMAMMYATLDGMADARAGRPAYFWAIFTHPEHRRRLLGEGWHRVARVLVLGVAMDALYQLIVLGAFRPVQMIVIVLGLAFVPYILLRGPIDRIAKRWMARGGDVKARAFGSGSEDDARRRRRSGRGRFA